MFGKLFRFVSGKRNFDKNKDINKADIVKYIKQGAIIIDVRSPQEYKEGHIDGAICIPDYRIINQIEKIIKNKNELIVVYCQSGKRSEKVQKKLNLIGYKNVYNVYGGVSNYLLWKKCKYVKILEN